MSKVMSLSSRPTFENAIALKTLSPLISIRAAIVEKSWDSSWLSDIRRDVEGGKPRLSGRWFSARHRREALHERRVLGRNQPLLKRGHETGVIAGKHSGRVYPQTGKRPNADDAVRV